MESADGGTGACAWYGMVYEPVQKLRPLYEDLSGIRWAQARLPVADQLRWIVTMDLLSLLVSILVIGLVCWLILYVIDQIPLPAPFHQVARVIVIVIAVILLIRLLLGLTGVHLAL